MKILCVIDCLGSGGAQRQLVNLAIALKKSGCEVSFLVYYDGDFYKNTLRESMIPVIEISEGNKLVKFLKVRKYIRSSHVDVVISFLLIPSLICELSALPQKKWRLVVSERSANPATIKSIKYNFIRFFHLFADAIVTNSYSNLEIIKRSSPFLSPRKLHVIYNLINLPEASSPQQYNYLGSGALNVLILASHSKVKNLANLAEAVNLLPKQDRRKIVFNWYGDTRDNSKDEALKIIKRYGLESCFNFYGHKKNVHELIASCDILGLFSLYEGLPNVVCEAMVSGKPVICSNVSDVPLFIDHSLLCNPTSPLDISKKLSFLLSLSSEDLKDIGERNKIFAKKLFDSGEVIKSYARVLGVNDVGMR